MKHRGMGAKKKKSPKKEKKVLYKNDSAPNLTSFVTTNKKLGNDYNSNKR